MTFHIILWSRHAEVQLMERPGVSREQIETVLQTPHQRFPDDEAMEVWVAQGLVAVEGKPYLVRVFYSDVSDRAVRIVSWYRTSQIRRYWRNIP